MWQTLAHFVLAVLINQYLVYKSGIRTGNENAGNTHIAYNPVAHFYFSNLNISCLLTKWRIKVKNKVCFIVICYFELKPTNIWIGYWIVEDRHPGKMMIPNDINASRHAVPTNWKWIQIQKLKNSRIRPDGQIERHIIFPLGGFELMDFGRMCCGQLRAVRMISTKRRILIDVRKDV